MQCVAALPYYAQQVNTPSVRPLFLADLALFRHLILRPEYVIMFSEPSLSQSFACFCIHVCVSLSKAWLKTPCCWRKWWTSFRQNIQFIAIWPYIFIDFMNNVSSVHSNVFFPNSAQCVLTLEDLLDLGQVNQSWISITHSTMRSITPLQLPRDSSRVSVCTAGYTRIHWQFLHMQSLQVTTAF